MTNNFQNKWISIYTQIAWFVAPLFMAFLMTMIPFQSGFERNVLFLFAAVVTAGISACVYQKKIFENNALMGVFPLILFMAICLRLFLFPHESGDFNAFLRHWMARMRDMGWPLQIAVPVTNYNPLYTYILAGLSYLPFSDLYLIKCASVVFDCVLGVSVLFILKNSLKLKDGVSLAGFTVAMIVPSFILNSGMWGQCDSFYASLLFIGLYLCMRDAPKRGCFFLGLALATKLQAAIVFPILLFFLAYGKVSVRHLFLILAAYVLTLVPAVVAGRSVGDIINIYLNQIGTYRGLTMGAPTFWAIFPENLYQKFLPVALGVASIVVFVLTFLMLIIRKIKDKTDFWDVAFLYALMVPYFLPKMHERYFYVAVVLAIIYLFKYPKKWPLSVGIILIDLFAYAPFLLGFTFVGIKWLALILLGITICILGAFLKESPQEEKKVTIKESPNKIGKMILGSVWGGVVVLGTCWILNTPFNQGEGWRFQSGEKFRPYWVSEERKILVKHPFWEEKLVKLSNKKIMRASVGDIAEIVLLSDEKLILKWNEHNTEHFVKNPETGVYQFQTGVY